MRMTLRQLQVFSSVCSNLSYSRAAEEMALTQPAVSLQIRQLEELIGQPLFDYIGKKLYLTEAAEALQRASADIFGRLESLDMQLTDLQGSLQGQLNLCIESSAKYFIPHLFAEFRREFPEVSLNLTVLNHAMVVRRLGMSRDDLLIMSQVPMDMDLDFVPFLNNPIVAVAASDHALSNASQLSLVDLTQQPLLVRENGSGTRRAGEEFCHQKHAHFSQVWEIGSSESQAEAVRAGLGIALMPRHAVRLELQQGLLRELPVAELPLYRSWCVVNLRSRRLSPVAQAFLDFIRSHRSLINQLHEQFQQSSTPIAEPAKRPLSG
ncbi:LysR family transcriptional regulator [Pseudomonas sp. 5P_3.1_Bac2]|nr:LysR family transcriptional regulator [Pseudomonas sp. 5P_3.1_Bac2]